MPEIEVIRHVMYAGKEFPNRRAAQEYRAAKELTEIGRLSEEQAALLVANATQVMNVLKPFITFRTSKKRKAANGPAVEAEPAPSVSVPRTKRQVEQPTV